MIKQIKPSKRDKDYEMSVFAAFDDGYAAEESLPLYLINGSLGAGKTTVLEYILSLPEFKGARIIENEFANENIDGFRLEGLASTVTTLSGDCICCSTGDELMKTLYDFSQDSTAPVLIEATGVARTMNLVEKLVKSDVFKRYNLAHSLFVIEAGEIIAGIDEAHNTEMQAADTIIVTKTDLLTDFEKQDLTLALNRLSYERVIMAERGVFDSAVLSEESSLLSFFDTYDGELAVPDNPTYSVIETTNIKFSPEQIERLWPALSDTYGLRRLKGAFVTSQGVKWHVEATKSQIEVSSARADEATKLVLIGKRADQITRRVFQAELMMFS